MNIHTQNKVINIINILLDIIPSSNNFIDIRSNIKIKEVIKEFESLLIEIYRYATDINMINSDESDIIRNIPSISSSFNHWSRGWRPGPLNLIAPVVVESDIIISDASMLLS